jgi:hypothetical protein
MALRSENKTRIKLAFKHLPYLIRKNLSDVDIYTPELMKLILNISVEDSLDNTEENERR